MNSPPAKKATCRTRCAQIAIAGLLLFSGCRQSAYNELYIEQMNTENRLLEDRIYEYDSAYRELELEAEALHQENDRLRNEILQAQSSRSRSPLFTPKSSSPPAEKLPPKSGPDIVVPAPDTNADSPADKEQTVEPPPPLKKPSVIESEMLEPPSIEFDTPPSALNAPTPQNESELELVSQQTDVAAAGAIAPDSDNPIDAHYEVEVVATEQTSESSSIDDLLPVDIESSLDDTKAFTPHLESSQIATMSVGHSNELEDDVQPIVELKFHPAFTRAIDADNIDGEESIRVLVQPTNSSGAIVEAEGHLTIVVVDPVKSSQNDSNNPARLGRWTFPADRLPEFFEPIGTAQGYRFELGPMEIPQASTELIIFVRLEFDDGRKIVNQYTVHANANPANKPVWTAIPK